MSKNRTCVDGYDGGGYYGNDGNGYERTQVQWNNNGNNGTGLDLPNLRRNGIQAYGTTIGYKPTFQLEQNNFNIMDQAKDAASDIINNNANNKLARSRMIQDRERIRRASAAGVASMESNFTYQITSAPAIFSTMY